MLRCEGEIRRFFTAGSRGNRNFRKARLSLFAFPKHFRSWDSVNTCTLSFAFNLKPERLWQLSATELLELLQFLELLPLLELVQR